MPEDTAGDLGSARTQMETAWRLLILASPQDLEHCEAALAAAAKELSAARRLWGETAPCSADAAQVRKLRTQVLLVRRLIEKGQEYYGTWQRVLAAMTGGYSPDGSPAPLCQRGRISLAG
jgi:hypothetical protein